MNALEASKCFQKLAHGMRRYARPWGHPETNSTTLVLTRQLTNCHQTDFKSEKVEVPENILTSNISASLRVLPL